MRWIIALAAALLPGTGATPATHAQTAPSSPDVTDVRLRAAHYAPGTPDATLLIDGAPLHEGVAFLSTSPQSVVTPGAHTLALVDGAGVPLVPPQAVTLDAAHDYTLALIGQAADGSLRALLLDETTLVAGVRTDTPASYAVLVHGISDGPPIDFTLDGTLMHSGQAFGEVSVTAVTQEPHDILVTFAGDAEAVLFANSGETPPANELLLLTVMTGSYPDALDVTGAVSRLRGVSVLDFLAADATNAAPGTSYTTLLAAIRLAGLAEALAAQDTLTLFAPTDAAFAALPTATRQRLISNPAALADLLARHTVPGLFSTRDLAPGDTLTLESVAGTPIVVAAADDGTLRVNGQATLLFGGFPIVRNGNVVGLDALLIADATLQALLR